MIIRDMREAPIKEPGVCLLTLIDVRFHTLVIGPRLVGGKDMSAK